jgi:ATP-dependent DNA helicase Rep
MKQPDQPAKNAGLSPEQALAAARSDRREREAAALYARYQQRLAATSTRSISTT